MRREATYRESLHDQWLAERDVWPGGEGFVDYSRRAARGFIFGREGQPGGAAWPLVQQARTWVRNAGPAPDRWEDTGKTSPSGKAILRCPLCGSESPAAGQCRAGCTNERAAWGWA
jgi:hypothetical protein